MRFDEEWAVTAKPGGVTSMNEASAGGSLSKTCLLGLLLASLCPLTEDPPFLGYRESTSPMRVYDLFQGGRLSQSELPASAVFTNFFTLKYSKCQGATFWGSVP